MNTETAGRPDHELDSVSTIFHRRIDFHVARKPYNGFINNRNDGFKLVTLNPQLESGKEGESALKSERSKGSESAGLDPELSLGITFRRIGAGLRNLGNTCFLNSVLQCLTYTEPLAAYLQSGKHQYSCRTAGFCALCAIQKHVSRALQSTGRILEPKDLVSNLRCISRNFRNARQEDAHEYMVNLLQSMHKCCLPKGVHSESHTAYEKSLVHKIFGGCLRSQVKCLQCSYCSNKFDPFLDLSLEIAKADTLHKALSHFTAKEHLDGGTRQYQCQECKEKVQALKQLTIHKAPHVLTVHLKRFGSHAPGQKIDKKVSFSPSLDLKPFFSGSNDEDLKYSLYGVLVHAGWSTHSGHYYCFVRTSSGMWYSLDDNQVVQVNESKVLEQKAYMLFYFRDRKSSFAKKPVDVQQENGVLKPIGNKMSSSFDRQLKDRIGNGSKKKELVDSIHVSLSNKGSLVDTAPSETPLERVSGQTVNISSTDFLSQNRGGAFPPTISSLIIDSVITQTTVSSAVEAAGSKPDLSGAVKNVGDEVKLTSHTLSNDLFDGKETSDLVPKTLKDEKDTGQKNQCESADNPPNEKDTGQKNQCESADNPPKHNGLCIMPKDACSIVSPNSSIVGETSKSSNDPTIVEQDGQKGTDLQSHFSFGLPTNAECSTSGSANDRRSQLRSKRNHFKSQVSSLRLSTNIIFGVAFSKQKRKHRKKSRIIRIKNLGVTHISANDKSPILCPSNTDMLLPVRIDDNLNNSQKEETKSREKMDLNGVTYTTENPSQQMHSAEVKGKSRNNDIVNVLKETTVTQWDGINVSNSQNSEPRVEPTQIGYVGDEWDEEYDRGKRKKVKTSKISFTGPNLFQEIASRNAERKRVKQNRGNYKSRSPMI